MKVLTKFPTWILSSSKWRACCQSLWSTIKRPSSFPAFKNSERTVSYEDKWSRNAVYYNNHLREVISCLNARHPIFPSDVTYAGCNLRIILEWAWDQVIQIKQHLDQLCELLSSCSTCNTTPSLYNSHSWTLFFQVYRCTMVQAYSSINNYSPCWNIIACSLATSSIFSKRWRQQHLPLNKVSAGSVPNLFSVHCESSSCILYHCPGLKELESQHSVCFLLNQVELHVMFVLFVSPP